MQKLPTKLYLTEQVRAIDRMAIEEKGIPGIDLMRKAGAAVFELIQKDYSNEHLIIFCGAGNNAGDGYVVAALALKAGVKVDVYYLSTPSELKGDALTAYQDYLMVGGFAIIFDDNRVLKKGIIIDALLGTGLDRAVSGDYEMAVNCIKQSKLPVIAIDIPSGLNADTGNVMGCAVKADVSVSFIALKQGMFTGEAAEYCGRIVYSSLGITDDVFNAFPAAVKRIDSFKLPKRHRCSHKGHYGHVLVVGGDVGFSGAINLAAEAVLRTGAGLVSVATRPEHAALINVMRPELMCHGIESASELSPLLNKATVVVIGPGLGQSRWAKDLLQAVLQSGKSTVCDADALNLLAKEPQYQHNWVLTPHPGEASRLLNSTTTAIAGDRFAAVLALQKQYGGVVVLKGAGTLISHNNEITLSTTGNPGMASGGMGDTLTGMIAGLIAQGLPLAEAATSAVYLHGKAADLSAQQQGEIGLLASDLMPFIRKLVNQ